jgi:SAM-dependent methyltransferase
MKKRSLFQKTLDFLFFPLRAVALIERDRWGLSALASERFFYVARYVQGYCLDVGCGKHNRFIVEFLNGNGKGVDVYKYEGLSDEHILADPRYFPFADESFDSVTFIANVNHIPEPMRDIELSEAWRCLKPGSNIIITMGNPLAEIMVHKLVAFYDRFFGTRLDMDGQRGMDQQEAYYLTDGEIVSRLTSAGFAVIRKRYFVTQWCLNHLFIAGKP